MGDEEGCHYCYRTDVRMTRDHIVPRARGGLTIPWNLVPACERCNGDKADTFPDCRCPKCREAVRRWEKGMREIRNLNVLARFLDQLEPPAYGSKQQR